MNTESWLKEAEKSITDKVKVGQKFEVRKLYEAVKWEELSKGDRIRFGKDFANAVSEGRFPNVKRIQKAENNHTQYIKVKEIEK